MTKLKEMVLRVASGDDNILIIGEPGTGKELVSKAIHDKVAEVINHFTLEILLESSQMISLIVYCLG